MMLRLVAMLLACAGAAHAQGLPAGWVAQGVGSPGSGGSAAMSNGTWTVSGGGADIWGTADQFHFVSQSFVGDGAVVAKSNSLAGGAACAKAGVMIRDGTAANAGCAFSFLIPANHAGSPTDF